MIRPANRVREFARAAIIGAAIGAFIALAWAPAIARLMGLATVVGFAALTVVTADFEEK